MQTKQKNRYAVDLGMTALLPLLMAYSLVGEAAHEWLGMAAFAKNRLTGYLLLRTHFVMLDFDVTLAGVLLDYLRVMGLFIFAGYYLGRLLQKAGRNLR